MGIFSFRLKVRGLSSQQPVNVDISLLRSNYAEPFVQSGDLPP